jgi:hypothetical protein
MKVAGYVLEVISVWMFISSFREAKSRDFLDSHGTEKGKNYAKRLRAVAVGSRVVIGCILLAVGLWMIGAFGGR